MSAMKPAPRMATLVGATSFSTGRAEAPPHCRPEGLRYIRDQRPGPATVQSSAVSGPLVFMRSTAGFEVWLDVHFEPVVHVDIQPRVIARDVERHLAAAVGVLIAHQCRAVRNRRDRPWQRKPNPFRAGLAILHGQPPGVRPGSEPLQHERPVLRVIAHMAGHRGRTVGHGGNENSRHHGRLQQHSDILPQSLARSSPRCYSPYRQRLGMTLPCAFVLLCSPPRSS